MKTYKIKKLIDGFKVKKEFKGKKLVCIPTRLEEDVRVQFDKEAMEIHGDKPLLRLEFEDKYGRGFKYKLSYYEWKPEEAQTELFV